MNKDLAKIIESKDAHRKKLSSLPFARKLEILDELRERSLTIGSASLRGGEQRHSLQRQSQKATHQQPSQGKKSQ